MSKKERDYTNLKETERVWDAVKMHGTVVKDYTLTHIVRTAWRLNEEQSKERKVHVYIGQEKWVGSATMLWRIINDLIGEADENGWLPRRICVFAETDSVITIDTREVNEECLRDHVAKVRIGESTATIDLEELLKATRYA